MELLTKEPPTPFLVLEGLEIPLDGDDTEEVQSLLGDGGLVPPRIGEAIVRGDESGPSFENRLD